MWIIFVWTNHYLSELLEQGLTRTPSGFLLKPRISVRIKVHLSDRALDSDLTWGSNFNWDLSSSYSTQKANQRLSGNKNFLCCMIIVSATTKGFNFFSSSCDSTTAKLITKLSRNAVVTLRIWIMSCNDNQIIVTSDWSVMYHNMILVWPAQLMMINHMLLSSLLSPGVFSTRN